MVRAFQVSLVVHVEHEQMIENERSRVKHNVWNEMLHILYSFAHEIRTNLLDHPGISSACSKFAADFLKLAKENNYGKEYVPESIFNQFVIEPQRWKVFFNNYIVDIVLTNNSEFYGLFASSFDTYLKDYDRIMDINFEPTSEDCILFQKKTTGIVESTFMYMNSFKISL